MKRSERTIPPCYFDRYMELVDDIDLNEALAQSITTLDNLDRSRMHRIGDKVYAPGKWTLKQVFQHLIDVERVMAYRSLRLARYDKTPLPGFDEGLFAAHADTSHRTLDEIIDELKVVRRGTQLLFRSLSNDALQQSGMTSGMEMSALAFGFTILGHEKHHLMIIEERYLQGI